MAECGEHALIARIRQRLATPQWVVVGPGDDAAVIEASLRFLAGEVVGERVVSSPNLPFGMA